MAITQVRPEPPLIVIAGPTASGKTDLAIRLAKRYNGEIISADSRTIYKGLDIGTAKPTEQECQGVPYWGIDLVSPGERFTAADYQDYAANKIRDIRSRNHVPFLVGGTGLYHHAIIYNYEFSDQSNNLIEREKYESYDTKSLQEYCIKNNIKLPYNKYNKRHLINAILRQGNAPKRRKGPVDNCYVVYISTDKETLRHRIAMRADEIFASSVVDEARRAAEKFGWDNEAMTGNIYPLIKQYLDGTLSLDEAKSKFIIRDWQLAKRQITWLKRSPDGKWLNSDDTYTYIAHLLDQLNNS